MDIIIYNIDMNTSPQKPFRIGFLLIDGFALMSYSTAIEPLRAANRLSRSNMDSPLYEWIHIPVTGDQSASSTGAVINGDAQVGDKLDVDLLLVIAGGDPFDFNDDKTFAWLRKLAMSGLTIGGISGGPVILVKAGLMEGRRMTVHWEHANGLINIAPKLAPNMTLSRTLYVMDRDRLTCAGGVAPLDLMHAILTNHHGAKFARDVSDWFLHTDIRPPGGAQKGSLIAQYELHHPTIIQAIEIMENHIADPLTLDDLAMLVHCTARHLNRLFQRQLRLSTMAFYRNLRLQQAEQLLQQTSLSLTEIAFEVGFSSSAHFSSAFRNYFGTSPKETRSLKSREN